MFFDELVRLQKLVVHELDQTVDVLVHPVRVVNHALFLSLAHSISLEQPIQCFILGLVFLVLVVRILKAIHVEKCRLASAYFVFLVPKYVFIL